MKAAAIVIVVLGLIGFAIYHALFCWLKAHEQWNSFLEQTRELEKQIEVKGRRETVDEDSIRDLIQAMAKKSKVELDYAAIRIEFAPIEVKWDRSSPMHRCEIVSIPHDFFDRLPLQDRMGFDARVGVCDIPEWIVGIHTKVNSHYGLFSKQHFFERYVFAKKADPLAYADD